MKRAPLSISVVLGLVLGVVLIAQTKTYYSPPVAPSYGEMTVAGTPALTLTLQNTYYSLDGFTTGTVSGAPNMTFVSGAPDYLLVGEGGAGLYHVQGTASHTGENDETYICTSFVGETEDPACRATSNTHADTQILGMTSACLVRLVKDDQVTMRCKCTTGAGKTITFYSTNLFATRVGP